MNTDQPPSILEANKTVPIMRMPWDDIFDDHLREMGRQMRRDLNYERQYAPTNTARYRWLFGEYDDATRPPESAVRAALSRLLRDRRPEDVRAEERRESDELAEAMWNRRARIA